MKIPKGIGKGEMGGSGGILEKLLNEISSDLTSLQGGLNGACAQLDLDATVTDTDYEANNGVPTLLTSRSDS